MKVDSANVLAEFCLGFLLMLPLYKIGQTADDDQIRQRKKDSSVSSHQRLIYPSEDTQRNFILRAATEERVVPYPFDVASSVRKEVLSVRMKEGLQGC